MIWIFLRLIAPQLQAQFLRVSDTRLRRLQGAVTSDEDRRRVPRACLPQVAPRRRAGSVLTHDCITNVQKRLGRSWTGFGRRICGSFMDPQLEHGPAAPPMPNRGHYACVRAVLGGLKLADPGIIMEPGGLTDTQSRPADLFTAAAFPARSEALDVCVASPNEAAARGDAPQAAFDRKLSHHWQKLQDLRNQGIHYHPLVWTADGRSHPAVIRTLQYAADIASSHDGQLMSANSLQHKWKHEIQTALLPRRAAMTWAVLPNPSARAEWLLAGINDGALNHWGMFLLLTVGLATTITQTQKRTRPYQTTMTTMTSLLLPVNRLCPCSQKASSCARLPLRATLLALS